MARFNAQTAENYGGNGGHGFFSLANDKDTARVRFMYNGIEDLQGYAVHEVEIDGRKRYVNCLREYNEPIDNCPFCADHRFQLAKLYVPLYVLDEKGNGEVKLWERGKKFISKIASICSRYPNLVSHIFEIERNGKKGEQTTTYEIYEVDQDDTILEDLPEVPEIVGGVVLDKSYEDMEYYLDNGVFPEESNYNSRQPERRTDNRREEVTRRTPSRRDVSARDNRSDRF